MDLATYLQEAVRLRWQPGTADCCTHPGDWARTWGRGDPMAEWRGDYRSDAQAIRLIHQAGGLLVLWQRGLASIGIDPVTDLRAGDVGVIRAQTVVSLDDQIGAIWTGAKWSFRADCGVIFAPADAVMVWGVR